MAASAKRRLVYRLTVLIIAVLSICYFYKFLGDGKVIGNQDDVLAVKYDAGNGAENLRMTERECRATFPGLMREIDESVSRGPFRLERADDDYMGLVQGRVANGKLYIISYEKKPNRDMLFERNAVLHALHRAILTTPPSEPLPNTTFVFTVLDTPRNNTWSFSRPTDPVILQSNNYWVMPHFSSWSWPLPFIGTMDEALSKIEEVEKISWKDKVDKVVWRGTAWFNNVGNTDLRPKLLKAARGKEWADVETLNWVENGRAANNSLRIEEFCRYKYVIYTEGITYSGRLPFHQACASVLITPPLNYMMYTTHFIRPISSSALLQSSVHPKQDSRWPELYPPSQANAIFVDPDWKDLEATIMWLRSHRATAEGIARRQRAQFLSSDVLGTAAETCYWRALVRGWNSVAVLDEKWRDGAGVVRWETFSLIGRG